MYDNISDQIYRFMQLQHSAHVITANLSISSPYYNPGITITLVGLGSIEFNTGNLAGIMGINSRNTDFWCRNADFWIRNTVFER
jgi:hypothetical protein